MIRKINPNVRPLIYDFTDQLPSFVNQGQHRRRLYKKMGFEILISEVKNNEIIREYSINDVKNIKNTVEKIENEECEFLD